MEIYKSGMEAGTVKKQVVFEEKAMLHLVFKKAVINYIHTRLQIPIIFQHDQETEYRIRMHDFADGAGFYL